jgi:amino-acid N-acetyltransferase
VLIRPAHPRDVPAIREMVDHYASRGILLTKATVTLYEDIQEFFVAEDEGVIIGCGALHVMWQDLAEVRTLAVDLGHKRQGLGAAMLTELLARAKALGIHRVFCLTFEVDFFQRHGFEEISDIPVDAETYAEIVRSNDEGVAEFLDLARVKQNTLGNSRMLKYLN